MNERGTREARAKERNLLVASNRGPVSFTWEDDALVARRGAGGLVSALSQATAETGGMWVAAAMSDGDRARLAETPDGRLEVALDDTKYRLRLLGIDPETYEAYYNNVSNRILWFLHHALWDVPRMPRFDDTTRTGWEAYRKVNDLFARALAEDATRATSILVQDYHLSLVPGRLRALVPDARIAHFHHSPFAGPDYARLLPGWMRSELLEGLLGADVLGFQSERWAESFLLCARGVEGASVDLRRSRIRWGGRTVRVRLYPISIDADALRADAAAPEVRRERRDLQRWLGDRRMVLRVDRTELSKNILRGFLAYGELLRRHPEWRRQIVFLALLHPSRRGMAEYREYTEQCLGAAERINAELGEPGWNPINVRVEDNFPQTLAAYGLYDALMVNPVADGMNLVAKEGPALNRHDGVLLLSRNTGAWDQLGQHAVGLDPLDVTGTADALDRALRMPEDERAARARALRRAASAGTPARWVARQLRDLEPED